MGCACNRVLWFWFQVSVSERGLIMVSFSYKYTPIDQLAVDTVVNDKTGKKIVRSVTFDGVEHRPSERFWMSLFSRYSFNSQFFRYFDHHEVFDRIVQVQGKDDIRLCIEADEESGVSTLLAVSNPRKPIVGYDGLMEILANNGCEDEVTYHGGIVESVHTPRMQQSITLGGDLFHNRFTMATPIDGYGLPTTFLMLLRQVCSNGLVAYSPMFKSSVPLGKVEDDISFAIVRAIDQYSNEEGFAALHSRITSSMSSWTSVNEAQSLYKTLVKLLNYEGVDGPALEGSNVLSSYHQLTGDVNELYGISNIDSLSTKRQKTLPVNCTVYDLINFITELASHHASPHGSRKLNAHVGTLISEEYDMEGTCTHFKDFADFHLSSKLSTGLTGSKA